ncbi:hypothetical protein AGR3A_Cc150055 [Agrobacterium tomkonis CFBP 6623]|uniref:Uncharacterized protein n=1 Tax=Agrobacterium tomkonis CFBP 6623 TaxID=1183432 RepID=A0A1S7NQ67_9HYPH|nr:hypothetical protein AGR3A_Cc150055 [Agrobacterium tomkonis CFBP 6623]
MSTPCRCLPVLPGLPPCCLPSPRSGGVKGGKGVSSEELKALHVSERKTGSGRRPAAWEDEHEFRFERRRGCRGRKGHPRSAGGL